MEFEATKCPATINVEAKIKELVDSELDENNFMYLGKKSAQRDELFLFGLALGWRHSLKADLDKPCSGGFIRTSSFSSQLTAMIDLIRFSEVNCEHPNALRDHKQSYKIAERYANAGLHMIDGEILEGGDSETYANELIAEMDEMYARFAEQYALVSL